LAWSLRQTCSDNLTGGEVKNAKGLSVVVFFESMGEGGACTIPRVMRAHKGGWFYFSASQRSARPLRTRPSSRSTHRAPPLLTVLSSRQGALTGGWGASPPPPPLCGSRHLGGVPPRRLVSRCPLRIRPASSAAAVAPSCHHPLPGSATVLQRTKKRTSGRTPSAGHLRLVHPRRWCLNLPHDMPRSVSVLDKTTSCY